MQAPSPSSVSMETPPGSAVKTDRLSWKGGIAFAALAAAAFHLAFGVKELGFLVMVFLFCLVRLTALPSARQAFYFGLVIGYVAYAPHLKFFWTIFGWPALALWTVLAFWLGLFVALGRLCRMNFGPLAAAALIPFVWTGLEYFRSELYYLRFSWLSVGYAFAESPRVFAAADLGLYGVGWLMAVCASLCGLMRGLKAVLIFGGMVLAAGLIVNGLKWSPESNTGRSVEVAGIQLEFPNETEIPPALDRLVEREKAAEILVLSEYTLQRPPPVEILNWCRRNHRYLVVGGREFLPDSKFANTLFVIAPTGEIVFRQVKSVPVQFFDDGIPAREQSVWDSPWGKIGFCICYDLSYRRVTDRLVTLGAEAIMVISADESDWGEEQHRQHARVAPTRAGEYSLPVFRVGCTGYSQWVNSEGRVLSTAPFPGPGEMIHGRLELRGPGRLPFDHWLAPVSAGVTAAMLLWLSAKALLGRFSKL